ncbi:MAG: hypothetical protein ACXWUF_19725 [Methylomagnum sp.]
MGPRLRKLFGADGRWAGVKHHAALRPIEPVSRIPGQRAIETGGRSLNPVWSAGHEKS